MKWPSGSGKAAVEGKRGRDKLNERAEGEDEGRGSSCALQGRDLWIKELQGWKEKKKEGGGKKKEEGEKKRTRRAGERREGWWKKKGDEAGRNKVPCQAGCTVSRETPARVSFHLPASF